MMMLCDAERSSCGQIQDELDTAMQDFSAKVDMERVPPAVMHLEHHSTNPYMLRQH
jgi:hypothetical protein